MNLSLVRAKVNREFLAFREKFAGSDHRRRHTANVCLCGCVGAFKHQLPLTHSIANRHCGGAGKFTLGSVNNRTRTIKKGGTDPYFNEEEVEFHIGSKNWANDLVLACSLPSSPHSTLI